MAKGALDSALDAALCTLHSVLCLFPVGLTVLGRPGDLVSSQPGKGNTARGQTHRRYAR